MFIKQASTKLIASRHYTVKILKLVFFSLSLGIACSCSSNKDTAGSRAFQNLSARYNYIYNSKVLLDNYQSEIANQYPDNYSRILPVYLGPEVDLSRPGGAPLKPMDNIIEKADAIILEKSYSNYVDEAYLLKGKACFFNGNYFNAVEYFDYVAKTFRGQTHSRLDALDWKARSLLQLGRKSEAEPVLDSLSVLLPLVRKKTWKADPLATMAQRSILDKDIDQAISCLQKAVKYTGNAEKRIRWTYILAQLFEAEGQPGQAIVYYRKVEHSNASFEMYFNARLNQIRVLARQSGPDFDERKQLLRLLRDDKNSAYQDQIYYQVGEALALDKSYTEALAYYQQSAAHSVSNPYQKGLSFLRVADLNLEVFKNYVQAKLYYDSAVITLPENFPDYDLIAKKAKNLSYLTNRLEVIALQDSLQFIARQPKERHQAMLEALVRPTSPELPLDASADINLPKSGPGQSTFYFSNALAMRMGLTDFRKRWGDRKLEDNWRQRIKSSAQETFEDVVQKTDAATPGQEVLANTKAGQSALLKEYMEALPTDSLLLARSNQKIIEAYFEMANFYLQELNSPDDAARTFQTLLSRFPDNKFLPAIYYSLYLAYRTNNPDQAELYKNKVLNQFPNSVYGRSLRDPARSASQSAYDEALVRRYNAIFDDYEAGRYQTVMEKTRPGASTEGGPLEPQLAYLRAISIGHQFPVDSLISALTGLKEKFPADPLITPLVRQHLDYIKVHLSDFSGRPVALVDDDPSLPLQTKPADASMIALRQDHKLTNIADRKPDVKSLPVTLPDPVKPAAPAMLPQTDGPFSTQTSDVYYYVIDVSDASLTLTSSRFGIGQFNRGTYAGSNLKHQLKEFGNDQLIYVGNFANFEDAKVYSDGIGSQLKQIMKVPVTLYRSFIISKENFDKIMSRDLLDKYLEFYKNNY